MTIEFETPYGKVSEKLVGFIKKEIIKLTHKLEHVARVEVTMKEDHLFVPDENKVCQIKLTIFGDNLVAYARSTTFSKAGRDAINDLRRKIHEHKESVEEVTTTIEV
jgi:ribosome-associated translation inhibitor RaiA